VDKKKTEGLPKRGKGGGNPEGSRRKGEKVCAVMRKGRKEEELERSDRSEKRGRKVRA